MAQNKKSPLVSRRIQKLFIIVTASYFTIEILTAALHAIYSLLSPNSTFSPTFIYSGITISLPIVYFVLAYWLYASPKDRLWRTFMAAVFTNAFVMLQGLLMWVLFIFASLMQETRAFWFLSWPQMLPGVIASIILIAVLLMWRRHSVKPAALHKRPISLLCLGYLVIFFQMATSVWDGVRGRVNTDTEVLVTTSISLGIVVAGLCLTYLVQSKKTPRNARILRALLYTYTVGTLIMAVSLFTISLPGLIQKDIPLLISIQLPLMATIIIMYVVVLVWARVRKSI